MALALAKGKPAAAKAPKKPKKPPTGKRGFRSKMPVKRSINLIVVDENKIDPIKAIPAILAIIVLAGLFSKFLVMDRLVAMSTASGKVSRLQSDLNAALAAIEEIGDVENDYAHYTYAGMTQAELDLVDRVMILNLVSGILPEGGVEPEKRSPHQRVSEELTALFPPDESNRTMEAFKARVLAQLGEVPPNWYAVSTWSVSANVLTIEVSGSSLEVLNQLAQDIERSDIVDSCAISTANKDDRLEAAVEVKARFIVYLQKPPEEVAES